MTPLDWMLSQRQTRRYYVGTNILFGCPLLYIDPVVARATAHSTETHLHTTGYVQLRRFMGDGSGHPHISARHCTQS